MTYTSEYKKLARPVLNLATDKSVYEVLSYIDQLRQDPMYWNHEFFIDYRAGAIMAQVRA